MKRKARGGQFYGTVGRLYLGPGAVSDAGDSTVLTEEIGPSGVFFIKILTNFNIRATDIQKSSYRQ